MVRELTAWSHRSYEPVYADNSLEDASLIRVLVGIKISGDTNVIAGDIYWTLKGNGD